MDDLDRVSIRSRALPLRVLIQSALHTLAGSGVVAQALSVKTVAPMSAIDLNEVMWLATAMM